MASGRKNSVKSVKKSAISAHPQSRALNHTKVPTGKTHTLPAATKPPSSSTRG